MLGTGNTNLEGFSRALDRKVAGLALAGVLILPSFARCAPPSDSWLTARTKIAFASDGRICGRAVSVRTLNGVVTVRGRVDDLAAKEATRELASRVSGVESVRNELLLVEPWLDGDVLESDETITEMVKRELVRDADLSNDSRLKTSKIGVETHDGIVVLSGDVPTIIVSSQASWTACQIPGVKAVRNELKIGEGDKQAGRAAGIH